MNENLKEKCFPPCRHDERSKYIPSLEEEYHHYKLFSDAVFDLLTPLNSEVLDVIINRFFQLQKEQPFETKFRSEWGGCLRYTASDGTIKNMAEELNHLESEKHK